MKRILFSVLAFLLTASVSDTAMACAACYGKSDSPMAKGMNAGIFSLMGVIGAVLFGAATFFVVLARRAAAVAKSPSVG